MKQKKQPNYPAHAALVRAIPRITLHVKTAGGEKDSWLLGTLDLMRQFGVRECPLDGSYLALVRKLAKGFSAKAYGEELADVQEKREKRGHEIGRYSNTSEFLKRHKKQRGKRKVRGEKPAARTNPNDRPSLKRALEKYVLGETIRIGGASQDWGGGTPTGAAQCWRVRAVASVEITVYMTKDGRWHLKKELTRRSIYDS